MYRYDKHHFLDVKRRSDFKPRERAIIVPTLMKSYITWILTIIAILLYEYGTLSAPVNALDQSAWGFRTSPISGRLAGLVSCLSYAQWRMTRCRGFDRWKKLRCCSYT